MRLHFESDEDLRAYIAEQVLTSPEVLEMLNVTKPRLHAMLAQGKFKPFKDISQIRLFFREDIEHALVELERNRARYGLGAQKQEKNPHK